MAIQWLTTWKVLRYLYIVGGLMAIILIPLVSSLIHGFETGDWKQLGESSGGTIFASEYTIQKDIKLLTDETLIQAYPEKYDKKYVDYLKGEILISLLFIVAWIVLLYTLISKVIMKVSGIIEMNALLALVVFLLAILVISAIEVLYAKIFLDQWVVPLKGLWHWKEGIFTNLKIWIYTGENVPLTVNAIG